MKTDVSIKTAIGWSTISGVCRAMAANESDELTRNVLNALGYLSPMQMIVLAAAMNELEG